MHLVVSMPDQFKKCLVSIENAAVGKYAWSVLKMLQVVSMPDNY